MYLGKKIVGLITARGGSKRLPRKNLKNLAGKPLIVHSIQHALDCSYVDEVFVSSEDEEILTVSKTYGATVLKRPDYLSSDTALHPDVLKYCAKQLNFDFDLMILFQPTTPIRNIATINKFIENFIDSWDFFDSAVPVKLFKEKLGTINKEGCYLALDGNSKRSQDLGDRYVECGTLFFYKKDNLSKENIYGAKVFPLVVKDFWEALDIDTQYQLDLVKLHLRYKNEK